jgi:putative membrane protein
MLKWIKRLFILVLFLIAIFIGVVFASDNNTPSSIIVFGIQLPELTVGLWVLVGLLLGACIGLLVSLVPLFFSRYSSLGRDRKIRQLQKELSALRVSGLKG